METVHANRPVVFTCWKEIAQYLGKGVRTVQRWEEQYGLPVQRPHGGSHKSSVIAHPHELDNWLKERWSDRANGNGNGLHDLKVPVSSSILKSHQLRAANHALVQEISIALQSLVKSCDELVSKRQELEG